MGCTSAKQVSAVPNDEEGRGKAYSNGDLFTDEYKMKGVEEVKYMRGEENRVNARNQENLVRDARKAMCNTGANSRRRSPHQTLSQTFTRQRASRNSSGCWMRRLRRGETTVQRRRKRTGHSTEAPGIHPRGVCLRVCVSERARVCLYVCVKGAELNQCFTNGGIDVTGVHVCEDEHMAKIIF